MLGRIYEGDVIIAGEEWNYIQKAIKEDDFEKEVYKEAIEELIANNRQFIIDWFFDDACHDLEVSEDTGSRDWIEE